MAIYQSIHTGLEIDQAVNTVTGLTSQISNKFTFSGDTFGNKKTIGSIDNQDFGIITNNTERLTVLKGGNVGIGTTNPDSLLQVPLTTAFTDRVKFGDAIIAKHSAFGYTGLWMGSGIVPSATNYTFVGGPGGDTIINGTSVIILALNNSAKMTIDSSGNVGIGTIDPKSKLQVVGGIQCGDDTAAASADKVGTTRYRATANASYVEMCMQVGPSSYSWVAIVTNTW